MEDTNICKILMQKIFRQIQGHLNNDFVFYTFFKNAEI